MQIQQIMSANPASVRPSDSIEHAAREMKTHGIGALPVRNGDRLLGIITDRDIAVDCVATGQAPRECRVRDHMTADPICIESSASVEEALRRMGAEQVRRLCVTQGGELVGIVSLGDLAVRMADAQALAHALTAISQPVRQPTASGGSAG